MRILVGHLLCLFLVGQLSGQCIHQFTPPMSERIANYEIEIVYDHVGKKVDGKEQIQWQNTSPDTLNELRLYMYLNAFKNTNTTFMKDAGLTIFGDNVSKRTAEEWGWTALLSAVDPNGQSLSHRYIQPDDGNPNDQTVLQILLNEPLLPGAVITLDFNFVAKLPRTIVRSGYSQNNFALWVHWFPQMGVYEQDAKGTWGWNCHQFFRQTEYYSDFGVYDVTITANADLVMGATGCLTAEKKNENGTITRTYHAEDVIDFAWTVYPDFQKISDTWENVEIELLITLAHASLAPRLIQAVKHALAFLNEHVGPYPYPKITMMDPPIHALNSGFMEYPTFITLGAFYNIPKGIRTIESLAIHEFVHQYFMGIVATNEKEEAWMDEGLTTYFEDRIMMDAYGPDDPLIEGLGWKITNRALTRNEYTGMNHQLGEAIATPSWEIKGNYKGLVYSKIATLLATVENRVGVDQMDQFFRTYFERWQFKHPKKEDFLAVVEEVLGQQEGVDWASFLRRCLDQAFTIDFEVGNVSNSKKYVGRGLFDKGNGGQEFKEGDFAALYDAAFTVYKNGNLDFSTNIQVTFENGRQETLDWTGDCPSETFHFISESPILSVDIDPEREVLIDLNFNNNSLTLQQSKWPIWRHVIQSLTWAQGLMQSIGFLL